jgi:hypothetical protein
MGLRGSKVPRDGARRHVRFVPLIVLAGACLFLSSRVVANSFVCSNTLKLWTATSGSVGEPASAPVTDTAFSPVAGRSRTYVTQGAQLFTYYNTDFPQGCTPGTGNACAPTGGTCSRLKGCKLPSFPTPPVFPLTAPIVIRSSQIAGKAYVFVAETSGRLYRVDVSAEPPYPAIFVETARPSCPTDRLLATPAVQLYASSNAAFKNDVDAQPGHAQDDVVYVMTSTSADPVCEQNRNRVIAYWASDLTVKWVFNGPAIPGSETGQTPVGVAGEGCTVDDVGNRLYCGANVPTGSVQDSLWAFSTLNGALAWSHNAGSILNRPTLNPNNGRLYVVNSGGTLRAYDAAGNGAGGPAPLWTTGLALPTSSGVLFPRSPAVEARSGTWKDKILVLDSLGKLFAVRDDGTSGALLWTASSPDAGRWVSAPVVLPGPSESKAFIGRNDGFLQMVGLDGGTPQGVLQISTTAGATVFDPVLDTDPGSGVVNRLVVVGGATVARIAVPLCANSPTPGGAIACNCSSGGVCGTGVAGDPFRCCDLSRDTCIQQSSYNPCTPWRCSVAPSCCAFLGNPCTSDANCGGLPGSCDLASEICTAPCGALTANCVGPSRTCQLYGGSLYHVPDGTACDDRRTCTHADPAVPLTACAMATNGGTCVRDRPSTGALVNDCPASAPICSGTGSSQGGQGGAVLNGRCCPEGTACDQATNTCRGNFGSASNSNDVCRSGGCLSDDYSACACTNPGDRACPPGETCCGATQGGCVDLENNPQHCGNCAGDCGEYTASATVCADDTACGSCSNDADCGALGGKCVDGRCGKCRGSRCQRLTNRGVCTAGVCTSGAACIGPDPTDLSVAASTLKGTSALGFDFTCESDGTSRCRAYVSNDRTDGGTALAQIDDHAVTTPYTPNPPDVTRLNGVAVSKDGNQLFAAMVNNGTPGLVLRGPGASTYARVKAALATGGNDDQPFDQAEFNTGPVGPAFDAETFSDAASRKTWLGNFRCPAAPSDGICTCVDNALCKVDFSNGVNWTATPEPYCAQPCAGTGLCDYATSGASCPGAPERISAVAFDRRIIAPATTGNRFLIVAHGTTLSFLDLDGGTPRQRDVNLANAARFNPNPARGESTVQAILSIAPLPYGDIVVEVRGAGDKPAPGNVRNTWLLDVNPHDRSVRDALDMQRVLKHVAPCASSAPACPQGLTCSDGACLKTCGACPTGFTCLGGLCHLVEEVPANFGIGAGLNAGNGRLAIMPSGKLLRWVASFDQPAAGMQQYDLLPFAAANCNDGDACTLDHYDADTGLCAHAAVSCEDGDACTSDTCTAGTGACLHAPVSCDDNNACTLDSCQAIAGCQHAPIILSEPSPAQFGSNSVLQWPATPDAAFWNTYRGTIPAGMLGSRPAQKYDQVCFESADALGDGPTTSTDASLPAVGTGFYYLVSGEQGCEGPIGHDSSGTPIPNASPCPTPP